jgi:hypothetical protein
MFGVNAALYGLRQFRMRGQYQQSLHEGRSNSAEEPLKDLMRLRAMDKITFPAPAK